MWRVALSDMFSNVGLARTVPLDSRRSFRRRLFPVRQLHDAISSVISWSLVRLFAGATMKCLRSSLPELRRGREKELAFVIFTFRFLLHKLILNCSPSAMCVVCDTAGDIHAVPVRRWTLRASRRYTQSNGADFRLGRSLPARPDGRRCWVLRKPITSLHVCILWVANE